MYAPAVNAFPRLPTNHRTTLENPDLHSRASTPLTAIRGSRATCAAITPLPLAETSSSWRSTVLPDLRLVPTASKHDMAKVGK